MTASLKGLVRENKRYDNDDQVLSGKMKTGEELLNVPIKDRSIQE